MKAHCIYGPPGTGKTTELIRLINNVLERNPRAGVRFLSHTRVAAQEAVSREGCKLHPDHASTIHSMCYRLLDLARTQVIDREKLKEFGDEIGIEISGENPDSERDLTDGDVMMAIYDLSRNRMIEPIRAYEESMDKVAEPKTFRYLHESYENWKDSNGYVDFTDMLSLVVKRDLAPAVDVFFCDEFQDLSPLQHKVFWQFVRRAKMVFVAGDDDQTIFEWGGADPAGMALFEAEFNAERKILDQSYRIPRVVHSLAEEVIARVRNRVEKDYRPRDEEGTIERLGMMEHLDWDEPFTFLYRDRSVRQPVEEYMQELCIPYRTTVGWPSPLDSKAGRTIKTLHEFFETGEMDKRFERVMRDRLTAKGQEAMRSGKSNAPWSDLVKMPPRFTYYLDRVGGQDPRITLSSIHSFKGAESDHIVLSSGMSFRVANNLTRKPDEEHRVFYVGVTRAKHRLTIVEGDNPYEL